MNIRKERVLMVAKLHERRVCDCGIPARYEHECLRSDIPIPQDKLKAKAKKPRTKSAWPRFFKKWKVGDSVVVSWTALASMQSYSRQYNQKIFWVKAPEHSMDGMTSARVWRIK